MFEDIIDNIKNKFYVGDVSKKTPSLEFITIKKEQAIIVIQYLKENLGFKHLVLLTAVDFIEEGNFQLTYLLNNPDKKIDLGVRVFIARKEASMETAHHLWATIATYQRELKEMFGIDFPDSPRVNEPFILEGWTDIPPYRRDFDTKAFAQKFYHQREGRETIDPLIHMKKNIYPNE